MNDFPLYCVIMLAGEIIVILPFILLSSQRHTRSIILLFALFIGNIIVTVSPFYASLHIGHWNWMGKSFAVLFSIILIFLLKLSPNAIGLQLPQNSTPMAGYRPRHYGVNGLYECDCLCLG